MAEQTLSRKFFHKCIEHPPEIEGANVSQFCTICGAWHYKLIGDTRWNYVGPTGKLTVLIHDCSKDAAPTPKVQLQLAFAGDQQGCLRWSSRVTPP